MFCGVGSSVVPDTYRDDLIKLHRKIINDMKLKGPDYRWSMNDFQIGAPLGRGKFGRVYLAREKNTHYMVAIKLLIKSELLKHGMQHQVIREIEIQTHLSHPHILPLLTYFQDDKRIYLVLEFASGGELFKQLQNQHNQRFSEATSAKFIDQVADAIDYCHKNKVIHRDIKPENLLLTATGDIMLADFGWSVHAPCSKRKTMCGTVDYLPPEMIENRAYNEKVDYWCVGVLCYELIVGKPPFETNSQNLTFERIKKVDVKYPSFMSALAKDLISKLLKYNPSDRLTMTEVRQHPWILSTKTKS
ncbi:hypothetical protein PGB90_002718 [Kerria lacca]